MADSADRPLLRLLIRVIMGTTWSLALLTLLTTCFVQIDGNVTKSCGHGSFIFCINSSHARLFWRAQEFPSIHRQFHVDLNFRSYDPTRNRPLQQPPFYSPCLNLPGIYVSHYDFKLAPFVSSRHGHFYIVHHSISFTALLATSLALLLIDRKLAGGKKFTKALG